MLLNALYKVVVIIIIQILKDIKASEPLSPSQTKVVLQCNRYTPALAEWNPAL